jgi:ParB-like chromosome segregation protein Spo0J
MTDLHIELRTLPVNQLVPAPYNPRRVLQPRDPAYRKLKASLEQFGLVEPLIWNETTGHVVGGHARLRILQELGCPDVPVSVVRLNEAQEKALNIVLNNQEAQGRYDPTLLREVLGSLHELPEFELTGFDDSIFDALDFESLGAVEPLPQIERLEITLIVNAETYERLAGPLDRLVQEFDLQTHIRHAGA